MEKEEEKESQERRRNRIRRQGFFTLVDKHEIRSLLTFQMCFIMICAGVYLPPAFSFS